MMSRQMHRQEHGIAAVWTAVILLFLIGATALAVDTSEFFQQARSQQRAVDLACLAGAAELPDESGHGGRRKRQISPGPISEAST